MMLVFILFFLWFEVCINICNLSLNFHSLGAVADVQDEATIALAMTAADDLGATRICVRDVVDALLLWLNLPLHA
jgi:hypothetical protein